jgi:hypothetical protein
MAGHITNVMGCSRCGGDHDALVFQRFANPIEVEPELTHWALCPTTGEPLLMTVTVIDDAQPAP